MKGLVLASAGRLKVDSVLNLAIEKISTLPSQRSNFAAAFNPATGDLIALGGLAGGSGAARYPANTLHFNTRTKAKSIQALSAAYTWSSGVGVGSELYFLDGHSGNYNGTFRRRAISPSPSTLIGLANAPTPYRHSSIIIHNKGKIYRIGGHASNEVNTKSCHMYNIATNAWSSMPDLPFLAIGRPGCVYNDKIYIFGANGNPNIAQVYDIATNTWTTVPIPYAYSWAGAVLHGKYFFMVSGTGSIVRYDMSNLNATPKRFKVDLASNRYSAFSFIDETLNEFYIAGGTSAIPGQAQYDDAPRSSQIVTLDLGKLIG